MKPTKEERKQRRREKQRIIARNFRKRKKETFEKLQEEVKRLRMENEQHRNRLNLMNFKDENHEAVQDVKSLSELIEQNDEENLRHVKPVISNEKFQNSVNFQFDELRKLSTPSDYLSKMILLGLEKDSSMQQQKVWSLMCSSMQLTDQQKSALSDKNLHEKVQEMRVMMKELEAFRARFTSVVSNVRSAVSEVSESLNNVQHAKHVVWKKTNTDDLKLVNRMWNEKIGVVDRVDEVDVQEK